MTWRDQVRVTLTSGEVVSLLSAEVDRDTLFGPPLYGRVDSIARYPVSMVRYVEVSKFSAGRTAGLVLGTAAGAVLLTFMIFFATYSPYRYD